MRSIPLLLFAARLAVAQTLPPRTPVRIVVRGQPSIEGRLVASDSATLTVAGPDSQIVVARTQVESVVASRPTTRQFAVPMGVAGGVAGAALGTLLVGGLCESQSCRNDWPYGALFGGALGGAAAGLAGVIIGGLVHTDQRVGNPIRVTGREAGPGAIERCTTQPTGQATYGGTTSGRATYRWSATAYCTPRFSLGGEGGRLLDETVGSYISPTAATPNISVSRFDRQRLTWWGGVAELPFGGVLNPRLVASAGYYRRLTAVQADTFVFNGSTSSCNCSRTETIRGGPGVGLGLAVSLPLWQHVSLGAEQRTHFYAAGERGTQTTFGVSVRVRP